MAAPSAPSCTCMQASTLHGQFLHAGTGRAPRYRGVGVRGQRGGGVCSGQGGLVLPGLLTRMMLTQASRLTWLTPMTVRGGTS